MALTVAIALGRAPASAASLDSATAAAVFAEAAAACERDGGALFVLSLCGPLLLVDPSSRVAVANLSDDQGFLQPASEGVWVGVLPSELAIANVAVTWAGRRWSMVLWPLPDDPAERARFIAHESFHRVQADLGLPPPRFEADYLDGDEARRWLRLEALALAGALRASEPQEANSAAADALRFRARRHELVAEAALVEQALERHEGLAEYAGVALAWTESAARRAAVIRRLEELPSQPSLGGSFAWATGPAYALLLDDLTPGWRRRRGVEVEVAPAVAAALPADATPAGDIEARALVWGAEGVRADEVARGQAAADRIAAYRAQLVEGTVLRLPLTKASFSFQPDTVFELEGAGTVYPCLTLSDNWGVLRACGPALVSADRNWAFVPAPPPEGALAGDSWTLELTSGWGAFPAERPGDLELKPRLGGRR